MVQVAYCGSKFFVDSRDILNVNGTRAELGPIIPAVGTRANPLTFVTAGHHWASH
jgi:hypothetical protein